MKPELVAGDTLNFITSGGDYPASAGWSIVYKLIPRTSGSVITITSSADGDDHLINVAAATTVAWTAGTYSWASYATKSGERQTLEHGTITIKPDPGVVTTLDTRSSARKALDAVDSALESYGAKAYLQEYEFAGRRQRFHTPGDFLAFRAKLQAEVRSEESAAAIAAGRRPRNQILARFNTR